MTISVLHPTRGRKQQALKTMSKWLFNADRPYDIEYIFSTDIDDTDKWTSRIDILPNFMVNSSQIKHIEVLKNDNKSAIEAINFAAKRCSGDLIIVCSDDFECPEHWDTLLLNELEGKSDFVLKTDDEYQPTLVSLPIMDRIFYERYGYIYHPDYLHMFCDQEMTAVALMTGKYLKSTLKFPHHHYTTGKTEKDEINVKNDMTWKQGQRLFDRHLENNFGIESPVTAYTDIQWR